MKTFLHSVLTVSFALVLAFSAQAQSSAKSLLINHGSSACGNQTAEQQFFSGSLSSNPLLAYTGSLGLPYGGVFSAYNPADQKIYFADINGTTTKVYVVNYNFGGLLATPSLLLPTYTYNYTLNQLCFDNAGNNYGFKSFNANDGKAKIEQIDITNGNTVNGTTKSLQFPVGHIPNTVGDGDMVILPNGRMFATFGNSPSMLYEFTPKADGNYNVVYLTNMPRKCYSIAYVDGNLVVSGSDGSGCYYYIWDINSLTLSSASAYPGGKSSADMSNLTAGVGVTNQLTGMRTMTANTAQVYYQIVIKNKGNIYLNNVQLSDDLNKIFGAGNVMGAQTSFQTNPAGLQLNPLYNGTTITNMLLPLQFFDNEPASTDSAVINLIVTATNLVPNKVYYNSAVASASLGAGTSYLSVSDSSNNGTAARMDLNNNGVSDDSGENVPTPFVFSGGILEVQGLNLEAQKQMEAVKLTWQNVATETYTGYEIERSANGVNFEKVGVVDAGLKNTYSFSDHTFPLSAAGVYYHIKGIKADNTFAFSNTVYIKNNLSLGLSAYPNPFRSTVVLQLQTEAKGMATIFVRNVTGRTVVSKNQVVEKGSSTVTLNELQNLQPGWYSIEVVSGSDRAFAKLMKQ